MRRFWLWIAIGTFALVGFLFRDFLSGNVSELKVGDCFDLPPAGAAAVKEVQHHPCTDSHGGEVVFLGSVTGAKDAYPGDAGFESFARAQCVPAYRTYTGREFDSDVTYDMSYLMPTSDGWRKGDHQIVCYALRVDRLPISGTVRAAP